MNKTQRQLKHQRNRKLYGIIIFFLAALIFAIFLSRFFYIAISHSVDQVDLKQKVAELYASKTEIKAQRGTIFDADKQPIAEDTSTYSVYVVLSKSAVAFGKRQYLAEKDKPKAARILSRYLDISYQKVAALLEQKNRDVYQVELGNAGKNISMETKQKIQAAKITGIYFKASTARLYPNGVFASHLIGLAENRNGQLIGVMGLEKAFNKQLAGKNGVRRFEKDTRGTPIPGSKVKARAVKNGDNIYTTLDTRLQTYLETLMSQAQATYHPQEMMAILMKAKTGEILAASQRPTFNAQTKNGLTKMWRDILVEDSYEPGSTMKIFTTAAAINSGNFNADQTYKSGSMQIDGKNVYDWNRSGWGYITYQDAFIRSSNVGMAYLEQKMGAKTWLKYIRKFGFLKKTGIKLPNEVTGSIEFKYPIEQANTAYGQAINVTALQMMQGFSAIANQGTMVRPYLIKKIVDPNTKNIVYQGGTKKVGQPISQQTAKQVLNLMEDVVYNKNGTGTAFNISGYQIGVKTGTAQISNSQGSGYLTGETNYLFSVVGIAPANDPQYILYVAMKQPTTFANGTSGQMLATIFNPMMQRALKESSESDSQNSEQVALKKLTGHSVTAVKRKLENQGLLVTTLGTGEKVLKQSVKSGETLLSGERIILLTSGSKLMPDLTGWSRGDAAALAKLLGIKIKIKGTGYVAQQSIAANQAIAGQKQLVVNLK